MRPSNMKTAPLLCWDIFMDNYYKKVNEAEKKTEINKVLKLARKYKWKNKLESLFNIPFTAIVITDTSQKIIWVNDGFTKMTGYSKKYALDKKPSFLQGEETNFQTIQSLNNKLKLNKPFKEVLTNYRKDKVAYKCEVNIFPLYTNKTTHFLALEREI